jgi:hypothetical protein
MAMNVNSETGEGPTHRTSRQRVTNTNDVIVVMMIAIVSMSVMCSIVSSDLGRLAQKFRDSSIKPWSR